MCQRWWDSMNGWAFLSCVCTMMPGGNVVGRSSLCCSWGAAEKGKWYLAMPLGKEPECCFTYHTNLQMHLSPALNMENPLPIYLLLPLTVLLKFRTDKGRDPQPVSFAEDSQLLLQIRDDVLETLGVSSELLPDTFVRYLFDWDQHWL